MNRVFGFGPPAQHQHGVLERRSLCLTDIASLQHREAPRLEKRQHQFGNRCGAADGARRSAGKAFPQGRIVRGHLGAIVHDCGLNPKFLAQLAEELGLLSGGLDHGYRCPRGERRRNRRQAGARSDVKVTWPQEGRNGETIQDVLDELGP